MIGILIKLIIVPVRRDCFFIFSEHLSTKRKCINENPVFQSDLSQNNSIASFCGFITELWSTKSDILMFGFDFPSGIWMVFLFHTFLTKLIK